MIKIAPMYQKTMEPESPKKIQINKTNILFALIIVVLSCFLFRTCENESTYRKLTSAQNDTMRTMINEKGQHVSTISILQGTVADLKHLNATKDSTLRELQQLVDGRHTISATVHGTVTGNTFTSGSTIIKYDTVRTRDTSYISPVYFTKYNNLWEKFDITASKDSFHVEYKVFNKFDYVTRYNRPKWHLTRVPEITVTNVNPHTETLELKNFTVAPPKGQKLLLFLGGTLVGSLSTFGIIKAGNSLLIRR